MLHIDLSIFLCSPFYVSMSCCQWLFLLLTGVQMQDLQFIILLLFFFSSFFLAYILFSVQSFIFMFKFILGFVSSLSHSLSLYLCLLLPLLLLFLHHHFLCPFHSYILFLSSIFLSSFKRQDGRSLKTFYLFSLSLPFGPT